jgi:hypothetical protein
VAAGAIQTPALLARSGLRRRQLGQNLSLHPNTTVVAFFDSDVTGWHGVHQAFQVREFMAEGLVLTAQNLPPPMLAGIVPAYGRELGELMADYNRIVTAGPLVEDTGTGRVRTIPGLGTQIFYRLTDADAARLVRGIELTATALFAAGARRMLLPFDGAPAVRSVAELRSLLARPVSKAAMQVYSIHLMGTARMSEDPRRGVTDSFGAVHGVPGLFIADASLFPGPLGINPMETVIALAMRNARRILAALRPDGDQGARHVDVALGPRRGRRGVTASGAVCTGRLTGHDQDVGGYGAGRAADQRVDIQRVHQIAQVNGEPGQGRDGVGDRVEVGGPLAAGSGQYGGHPEPGKHPAGA